MVNLLECVADGAAAVSNAAVLRHDILPAVDVWLVTKVLNVGNAVARYCAIFRVVLHRRQEFSLGGKIWRGLGGDDLIVGFGESTAIAKGAPNRPHELRGRIGEPRGVRVEHRVR